MKYLVVGGAGYIGSHAVIALQDRGDKVIVIDNLSTGHAEAIPLGHYIKVILEIPLF